MSTRSTTLERTQQLLECAQLLTEKSLTLNFDHSSVDTYRAWNTYLSDMIEKLYNECCEEGHLPAVFSRSFEDLFETPEQDFLVLSHTSTASAAIMEMFATALSRSVNRHIELSISRSRFATTAGANIGIPINPMNTQPYAFRLHWYVECIYRMPNDVSVWQVIQTVIDETPEEVVE